MNTLAAAIYVPDAILIVLACLCMLALLLNLAPRVNWLALGLLLFFVTFLTACQTAPAPTDPPQATRPAVIETTQDLKALATQAAEAYIAHKNGDANYAWSIAAGLRAYQTIVKTAGDVKNVTVQFSEGKKAGKSFATQLAELFASSSAPPAKKAEVIAQAVEKAAAK